MHMSKMIQIRNVPEELHRKLKARAAMEGLSLSDFLLREIIWVSERPSLDELRERLRYRPREGACATTSRVEEQAAFQGRPRG